MAVAGRLLPASRSGDHAGVVSERHAADVGTARRPPQKFPNRLHHPFRRLLRQKVPAILEVRELHGPKRRPSPLQFLPPERDVLHAPENQRRLSAKAARSCQIERSQSLAPTI